MPKTPQTFSLSGEAKRSLNRLLKKGTHATRELTRARILLKLDQGLHPKQVAHEVDVSANTVYNIRKKANDFGWQIAIKEPRRSGRPARFSGKSRAEITALACSDPPKGRARWTLRLLADKAVELGFVDQISHQGVREILKKTNSNPT